MGGVAEYMCNNEEFFLYNVLTDGPSVGADSYCLLLTYLDHVVNTLMQSDKDLDLIFSEGVQLIDGTNVNCIPTGWAYGAAVDLANAHFDVSSALPDGDNPGRSGSADFEKVINVAPSRMNDILDNSEREPTTSPLRK